MPTNVVMPQMGESVTEGTITKWLKKEGEIVRRDEPLFEISTDKVDTEIPASAGGILCRILLPEGSKVPINTVVATIEEAEVEGAGRGVSVREIPASPPPSIAAPLHPAKASAPAIPALPSRPTIPVPQPAKTAIHAVPLWAPGKVAPPAKKTDWSACRRVPDFDDLVYCVECGSAFVARAVLGSGDAVVPDREHAGKECRVCLALGHRRDRYRLVRTRGDLGFPRDR